MPLTKVFIVDDHPSIRLLLRSLLQDAGEFAVCGEAVDGVDAIEKAQQLQPDIILLDFSMPRMNGAEAAPVLKRLLPKVPIILFTMHEDLVGKALASARVVDRVVAKPHGMGQLLECIRSLLGSSAGSSATEPSRLAVDASAIRARPAKPSNEPSE
jgi:two-component system, NarL family, response regulator NreC